jgi:hypothetical protein
LDNGRNFASVKKDNNPSEKNRVISDNTKRDYYPSEKK